MSKRKAKKPVSGPQPKPAPLQAQPGAALAEVAPSPEVSANSSSWPVPEPARAEPSALHQVNLSDYILAYKNWVLLVIMALATTLRLFRLDYRSIWYDESFSIILARQDLATIIDGTAHDYHPPLFYLLLAAWQKLFGEGLYSARLLSVLFGLAAILMLYELAKALFGPKTALLAALIAALAPFQVLYSQEVRMYSLQFLLGAWLILAFYQAYRRDSRADWAIFGLVALSALYNLYFSIFSLLVLDFFFVGAIVYSWRRRKRLDSGKFRRWLLTNLLVGLFYLPWFFGLIGQVGRVKKSYWISLPNPLEIFRLLAIFLYNTTNLTVDQPFDLLGLLLAVFFLLFMLQTARFRLRQGTKGRTRRSFEVALTLTCWLAPVLLVLILSYLFAPIYLERSLIAGAVPAYVLLARLVQTGRRPNLWPLLLVPGLALLAISLYFYFFSNDYTVHYDSASTSAYIAQNYKPGDVVIHSNKLSYLPFVYLKTPGPQYVVPEEPGNPHDDLSAETQKAIGLSYTPVGQIVERLAPGGRVWLVLTPPQPGQTDYQEKTVKGYLENRFGPGKGRTFYGATLFLYAL